MTFRERTRNLTSTLISVEACFVELINGIVNRSSIDSGAIVNDFIFRVNNSLLLTPDVDPINGDAFVSPELIVVTIQSENS